MENRSIRETTNRYRAAVFPGLHDGTLQHPDAGDTFHIPGDRRHGAMSVSQLMAVYEEQGDSGVPEHVQKKNGCCRSCCQCCDNCCRLCK